MKNNGQLMNFIYILYSILAFVNSVLHEKEKKSRKKVIRSTNCLIHEWLRKIEICQQISKCSI